MSQYSIHAAKTNLSRLIEEARSGGEVIIAKGQTPVVRLTPIPAQKTGRRFGAMAGRFEVPESFFEPMSEEELSDWDGGK